jgi:predicted transcriptional regulator
MSAAHVRAALGGTLAYTTVMTVLTRLTAKGLAVRQRGGRAHVYAPVRDGAEVTARRMRRVLDSGDDPAGVLARFVGTLSDEEESTLIGLLADQGRGSPDDR